MSCPGRRPGQRDETHVLHVLLLLTGCGCIAFGVWRLAATRPDDARKAKVDSYNAAVSKWRSRWSTEAQPANSLRLVVGGLPGGEVVLDLPQAPPGADTLHESDPALASYTQRHYLYTGALQLNTPSGGAAWAPLNATLQLQVGSCESCVSIGSSKTPLARVEELAGSNAKRCAFGAGGSLFARERLCRLYVRATGLCLLLLPQGGLDPSGCNGRGAVVTEVLEDVAPREGVPAALEFSPFTVTVRHAGDPYLVALQLTNGHLFFGTTPQERVLVGVLATCFGIVFAAYAVWVLAASWQATAAEGAPLDTPDAAYDAQAHRSFGQHVLAAHATRRQLGLRQDCRSFDAVGPAGLPPLPPPPTTEMMAAGPVQNDAGCTDIDGVVESV